MNRTQSILGVMTLALITSFSPEAMAVFPDAAANKAADVVSAVGGASKIEQIQSFVTLAIQVAYLLGAILFIMGLWGFKKAGENAAQYPVMKNVMTLVAGALLLSISTFYNIASETISSDFSGSSKSILEVNPHIADLKISAKNTFSSFIPAESAKAILAFVYMVGLFSFIKGIYMMKDIGGSQMGGQNGGSAGKCITHIIGGVLAMNITKFSCMVGSFLGSDKLCLAASVG